MSMQWQKPTQAPIDAFESALPQDPGVQRKKMFGMPCAFVNGNMFAGVFQTSVMLRLPEEQRAEIVQAGEAGHFSPMGRQMREYVLAEPSLLTDRDRLGHWLDQSLRFAAAMPVKEPKPRKKKAS